MIKINIFFVIFTENDIIFTKTCKLYDGKETDEK